MNLVRKNILNVQAYKAGKPIEETKRELGLKEVIKLASNENPLGASPKAIEAIKKAAGLINRYPDSNGFYLKKKIALKETVKSENIVLGNGSDELIDTIIKTFVEDDEEILTADNTFLEYKIIASVNNKKVVTVPLKNYKFDLDEMLKKVTAKTKLVFIANPNNPTGTYVKKSQVEKFMAALPKNTILVLDEAYDLFIDGQDYPKGLDYVKKGKNVIVLKTFSKAYGLAGVRIGYALANEQVAVYMERVRQPFNVNLLAQVAAVAALDDKKFLKETRDVTLDGKYYLYDQLYQLDLTFIPSVTNFVLVDVKRDCIDVFKALLKLGVIVRDMTQYNMNTFIRVSVGLEKENQKFIKALKKVLS